LPIWDRTLVVFTSTIRINSDLLWYGTNALEATSFFAASQTVLEVARTISHYADNPVPVGDTKCSFMPTTQAGRHLSGIGSAIPFG
jgi:hypothetical protein